MVNFLKNIGLPSIVIAITVLILLSFKRSFVFSTDDYSFLYKALDPNGFDLLYYKSYLARVPLQSLFMWLMFKTHFINHHSWFSTYIMFTIHCLSLVITTYGLAQKLKLDLCKINKKLVWLTLATFCFYPNNYEILWWPTAQSFIWGALLFSISVAIQSRRISLLFMTLSFFVSEMFILPALAIRIIEWNQHKETKKLGQDWLVPIVVYLGTRFILIQFFGAPANKIHIDPINNFLRISNLIQNTFFFQYSKTYFAPSIPFLLGIGIFIYQSLKQEIYSLKSLISGLILIFGSLSIYLIMNYDALRALYGGHLFSSALATVFILKVIAASPRSKAQRIGGILIALSFLLHNNMVFKYMDTNAKIMQKEEDQLKQRISECTEPCTLQLQDIGNQITRGWVMHPDYYHYFGDWVRIKYFPNKTVHFEVR